MTFSFRRVAVLAVAPQVAPGDKSWLLHSDGGSDERSLVFPIPITSAFLPRLARGIDPAHAGRMRFRVGRLSVASHNPIARDARTDEVTSSQKWFR